MRAGGPLPEDTASGYPLLGDYSPAPGRLR